MSDNWGKTLRLFVSIGEIDDEFVEEAERAAIIFRKAERKKLYKYGAIASGVVAMAYLLYRSGKKGTEVA
ncbi:MAG: hypothetical protein FWE24_09880 [Defluviitaleaceae bacterium]|nr:hypothetical protein [Defluviitaleaceae bacterium]